MNRKINELIGKLIIGVLITTLGGLLVIKFTVGNNYKIKANYKDSKFKQPIVYSDVQRLLNNSSNEEIKKIGPFFDYNFLRTIWIENKGKKKFKELEVRIPLDNQLKSYPYYEIYRNHLFYIEPILRDNYNSNGFIHNEKIVLKDFGPDDKITIFCYTSNFFSLRNKNKFYLTSEEGSFKIRHSIEGIGINGLVIEYPLFSICLILLLIFSIYNTVRFYYWKNIHRMFPPNNH